MLLLDQAQITGLQQKLHVTNNSEYQENTNTTSDEDFYQPENTVLELLCWNDRKLFFLSILFFEEGLTWKSEINKKTEK